MVQEDKALPEILQEVILHSGDPEMISAHIKRTYLFLSPGHQVRLQRWISFMIEHHYQNPGLFTPTIEALFDAARNNDIFRSQTQHEFEISREFYLKVIQSQQHSVLHSSRAASYLLSISLVLAKYPGMQRRSLKSGFQLLGGLLTEYRMEQLFRHLFCKWNEPNLMIINLDLLKEGELEILMQQLSGRSLYKHPLLPMALSRKEASIISTLPDMRFGNHVLHRSILAAKIVSKVDRTDILPLFLRSNNQFLWRIDVFEKNLAFWQQAYRFLAKGNWVGYESVVGDLIDYFECHIESESFTFKRRTIHSMIASMLAWHEESKLNEAKHETWLGSQLQEYCLRHRAQSFFFKELTTGEELIAESDSLKHCASSYIWACQQGYCSIWSMRMEKDGTFKQHMTIEVRGKELAQIAGLRNTKPSSVDLEVIEEWSAMAGLVFERERFEG